jgi:hypothetical protein
MVVVALLSTLPFKQKDQYLLPVKISSQSLLPYLIYSLISLQKALGGNHLPPKTFWSILQVSSAKRLINISGTVRDREEVKVSERSYYQNSLNRRVYSRFTTTPVAEIGTKGVYQEQ